MTLIFKNITYMNLVHFSKELYPQNNDKILHNMMLWKKKCKI